MEVGDARRLKGLEEENRQLKRLVAWKVEVFHLAPPRLNQ
jgi:hypothetical protein